MKILGGYQNGNYTVAIYSDGTKIRRTAEDEFKAEFPESMDCKITNYCDIGCDYCHEMSSLKGHHGDILNAKFIDSLVPFTEMAIGGGDPLSHPSIIPFLDKLKERRVIASMTVNQKTLRKKSAKDLLTHFIKNELIYGIGVSLDTVDEELLSFLDSHSNAVVHVILGVTPMDEIRKLYGKKRKILFLGYKEYTGRGLDYYNSNKEIVDLIREEVIKNFEEITKNIGVVSFDNKAVEQFDLKNLLPETQWNKFFMGDDGEHTMYVDLVKQEYAMSSTSKVRYTLKDNIRDMFHNIKMD